MQREEETDVEVDLLHTAYSPLLRKKISGAGTGHMRGSRKGAGSKGQLSDVLNRLPRR